MILVFGSNESGIHGAGAARHAMSLGATMGMGFGPSGNTFAIPTKDWRIETLPLAVIENYVQRFIVYARMTPEHIFQVTQIGCGLAGLRADNVAIMFNYAPDNCQFDEAWEPVFKIFAPKRVKKYWGTF